MTYRKTPWPIPFKILTVNFDPGFPGKRIACAFKCDEDPKCVAFTFKDRYGCKLLSLGNGTTVLSEHVFKKAYGKIQYIHFFFFQDSVIAMRIQDQVNIHSGHKKCRPSFFFTIGSHSKRVIQKLLCWFP